MLDKKIIKEIESLVSQKPRSIQEIALRLKKNWRTIDRYVSEIEKEYGTIATRTFREGTRGALKIVYWTSPENASSSVFQEQLEKDILSGRKKTDFTPIDIFQFVDKKHKKSRFQVSDSESLEDLFTLNSLLSSAQTQVLIFSGNLSIINFQDQKIKIYETLKSLVKKGVSIKIVCRVDIGAKENVEKMLSLNNLVGNELVEIHHRQQPLRAIIIDKKLFDIKEINEPSNRAGELSRKVFFFFTVNDKSWVEWLTRIFWKMFNSSIGAEKRLEELNSLTKSNNSG